MTTQVLGGDAGTQTAVGLRTAILNVADSYDAFPKGLRSKGAFEVVHNMRSPADVAEEMWPTYVEWLTNLGGAADIAREFDDHVNFTEGGQNFNATRALESIVRGMETARGKILAQAAKVRRRIARGG